MITGPDLDRDIKVPRVSRTTAVGEHAAEHDQQVQIMTVAELGESGVCGCFAQARILDPNGLAHVSQRSGSTPAGL